MLKIVVLGIQHPFAHFGRLWAVLPTNVVPPCYGVGLVSHIGFADIVPFVIFRLKLKISIWAFANLFFLFHSLDDLFTSLRLLAGGAAKILLAQTNLLRGFTQPQFREQFLKPRPALAASFVASFLTPGIRANPAVATVATSAIPAPFEERSVT